MGKSEDLSGDPDVMGRRPVLKFEMHRQGIIGMTEYDVLSEKGIVCYARASEDGPIVKFRPPQKALSRPLRVKAKFYHLILLSV